MTVKGFTAQNFNGNGFFVLNATGYTLTKLRAMLCGVYGVYAFNSRGGTMSDSEAAWNNDSGFYIGQTPPQTKPIRSIVRNVSSYGNVLGFSGTNMRYVTITKSKWFNNGLGIVPNALDSEKYAPPEDNVITDNDIFWNNFNYYAGAPFKLRPTATDTPYPVGIGVLLFGGRTTRVEGNRVYGNYLVGVGAIQQVLLKQKDAQTTDGNVVRNNTFGAGGADLNGRDLFYDGNGKGNCWGPNTLTSPTEPANGAQFVACPFSGQNTFDSAVAGHGARAGRWTRRSRTGSSTRTPPSPATRRSSATSRARPRWSSRRSDRPSHQHPAGRRRPRGPRRGAGARRPARGQAQAAEEDRQGLRQLLRPDEADGQRRLDRHLEVDRAGRRRARRQAHEGPEGREEVLVGPGVDRLRLPAAAHEARAPTGSSAPSTRRTTCA